MPTARPRLLGRRVECEALDDILETVRDGTSVALVIRGEAGIGKSALMNYCAGEATDCRLARIVAVKPELELPFAALHEVCRPLLPDLDVLPQPQQQALKVALGLVAGSAPDLFAVGLAVLGLLAEVPAEQPLVCLIDDAQWLDEPSSQVLGFVGRRLSTEAALLLFAVREAGDERLFPALPSLTLGGLAEDDARASLTSTVPGQLDDRIRDRIVAETNGNPLRLLELPREMSPGELAGGFAVPRLRGSSGPMEEQYARRVAALPAPTQRLLLLASADPTGDATLLWRAARTLALSRDTAVAAESEGLLDIGADVRFRHPLIRSAAYAAATTEDRRAVHAALAEATDATVDAELRVWHLAAAAAGTDEAVAAELEAAATTARGRCGWAAAAAFLQRSVELTADPERLAERALAAAQAHLHVGSFDAALGALAEARAAAVDDVQRSRVERLMGLAQLAHDPGAATPVLLKAAKRLEQVDVDLARETYLDAWLGSLHAGSRARPGCLLPEVSSAALSASTGPEPARVRDRLLDGLATVITDRRSAAAASLRTAVDGLIRNDVDDHELLPWGALACTAANLLWDCDSCDVLTAKFVETARVTGALHPLAMALNMRGTFAVLCDGPQATTALVAEYAALVDAIQAGQFPACRLLHAAYQGRPEAVMLVDAATADLTGQGAGLGVQHACWAKAILCNGLGRYADALSAAEQAAFEMELPNVTGWALPELIEAAVRSGQLGAAREAMQHLSRHTVDGADWAAGITARSRALTTEGSGAERWYAEALERLSATPLRTELARAHLLYGEWLRRGGRRVDAREQLSCAYDMFTTMGAEAFAERARRELLATGEKVRKRSIGEDQDELTPQEEQVARLARDGRTNAEIGAELFLSVRTVEWHLRKVYMKLGVSSRKDLKHALPTRGSHLALAG